MMLKNKTTSRKFYGKWLYKASIYIPGVAILRSKSLDDIIDFLAKPLPQTTNYRHSLNVKAHANAAYLIKLCKFLKPLQIHLWTKRIETNQLDFYTNDQSIYNDFCNKFNLILINFLKIFHLPLIIILEYCLRNNHSVWYLLNDLLY